MFIDQNAMYSSTPGTSLKTCPPLASSFSSSSDSPSMWEAGMATPVSTPLRSPVNLEDSYISSTASFSSYYTPEKHANGADFCANMSQDMPIGFQDSQMSFTGDNQPLQDQNMMGYNFTGYSIPMMQPCDGLPRLTPSLDFEGCSPSSFGESSPTSADFVIPSQTTFDPFDMQSPMKQINSLHIDLQYTDDYSNEFMLSNSPMGSLRCFQGSTVRSCSTTPSLSSTSRQPKCEPIESAIALQRVQTLIKEDPDQKPEIKLRMHRRKIKRESRHPQLPQNILHAEKADKPCLFPGCGKKFRRSEHLKRHARIHDPQSCEAYPCPFCPKIFDNRSDNLKQHVKIHGDPTKKSSRTEYIGQRALDWLAAKDRETRRSKVKKEEAA